MSLPDDVRFDLTAFKNGEVRLRGISAEGAALVLRALADALVDGQASTVTVPWEAPEDGG